jgi:hypothetical protein
MTMNHERATHTALPQVEHRNMFSVYR